MKLPAVSGSEAVKAFRKIGYEVDDQHGSHIIIRRFGAPIRRTDDFQTIMNKP